MDILDKVVQELSNQNLMIILDNHMSDSDWCCNENDGNGLWYNARYPESNWLQDWKNIVSRYMKNPYVVGADLRNELRKSCGPFLSFNGEIMRECRNPTWGSGSIEVDWHRAATNAGNTILSVNPNLLIIVEGLNYALDLTGAYSKPISFNIPNRLVYEAHDYSWDHPYLNNFVELSTELGDKWGFLLKQNQPYTAPVWVGEFGTCHSSADCVTGTSKQGRWFTFLGQYLANADIDWSYWAIDGTQASGTGRTFGDEEVYGILNMKWDDAASTLLLQALQKIQNKTQGP